MSDQKSIGKIASDQIRRTLVNNAPDDKTLKVLTRALPMFENLVDVMMADFGPYTRLLDDPQAMLFLLANSRDAITAITTKQPPTLGEQATQIIGTNPENRARIWTEVHKAIRRDNASMALVCLRALVGHDGWTKFTIDSLKLSSNGWLPAAWVVTAAFSGKACGAMGVLALPIPIIVR